MRAIVQRVLAARVDVDGETVGQIPRGLCCFVGAGKTDTDSDMQYMAEKIVGLRIFPNAEGKMSLSVKDISGEVLLISQFTVYGDMRHGRRPSFTAAMAPAEARLAFEQFVLEEMELAACARRDLALRINNPMPGQVPLFAHSRECVTDLPGTSRITGEDRDLAIGRHLAVWNAGYSLVKSPAHRIVNSLVQLFHPGLPRNLRL